MAYGSVQGDGSSGFANLRQVIDPRLAALPDAAIRLHMEAAYGPEAAEQYEEYLEGVFGDIGKAFGSAARDVGKFAGKAAPAIATVGGGALQGAQDQRRNLDGQRRPPWRWSRAYGFARNDGCAKAASGGPFVSEAGQSLQDQEKLLGLPRPRFYHHAVAI